MNVKDVIKALGGATVLARALGLPDQEVGAKLVRAWGLRDSVPAEWFAAVARVALLRGHPEITVEALAQLAERRRLSRTASTITEAAA